MKLRGNEQGGIKNASGLGEHLGCSPCGDWRSMRAWASTLAGPEDYTETLALSKAKRALRLLNCW